MPDKKTTPGSLLANEATGGEIAEGGFKFQNDMILARLPIWLSQSGFSQLIREALGDAEARFFVPGAGSLREFNEYKNYRLTPSTFWPEIDRFLELENAHPGAYRSYRLVCTAVNDELQVICRALGRVRRALPFYDGVSSIEDSSFEEFAEKVMEVGKRDRAYAEFFFKKVEVYFEAPRQSDLAMSMFQAELEQALPESAALNGAKIRSVGTALRDLITSKVAKPISRGELVTVLREAVPDIDWLTLDRTRIFTVSKPESTWQDSSALILEWERFSGQGTRLYPDPADWQNGLEELTQTRDWVLASAAPRTIHLQGTRRLSASVAFGATFSATSGFVIEVENRDTVLRTDHHAGSQTPDYNWIAEEGTTESTDEIVVVISVKRTIVDDVRRFLAGTKPIGLILHSSEAMVSADQSNLAVELAKEQISSVVSKTGASLIHLFLAVPSTFALFLGHRLNATSVIQCYEHKGGAAYTPTFRFSCA